MGEAKRKKDRVKDNTLLGLNDKFKFLCHKGLKCFNQCCKDVNIFLTPYDILRMKNSLKISSTEFLKRYTNTIMAEDWGLPDVVLKMRDDEDKTCPFVTKEGCTIYQDRPWPCRIYPLQPETSKKLDKQGGEFYTIIRKPFCLGFDEHKEWTVKEWKQDQEINIYIQMEMPFKEITLDKRLEKEKILNEDIRKMFYMACYDLDRFKKFVFETKFLNIFEIDEETVKRIKMDDVELLNFGFKWIKFGLLQGDTLKIRKEVLEAKRREQTSLNL
jgi:Fe-S-cluster containining protein